ncbi:MAG TPA: ATP-dependent RecD-like DNA helicase [Kiritimatiellia bacterium]|nr:ATP-dependent RecD-like DNA helicase [Kiritimatiellia bacterium]
MLETGAIGPRQPAEHLEGPVERVTFHSEETGFAVLKVKAKGHRGLVTVVGQLPNVVPGEIVQAQGAWLHDQKHGRQFKSESIRTVPPESIDGITRFLGSGLIRGIGPVYAGKLVEAFGKDIFDVIENRSALLERVEGIGRMRRLRIKESWGETRSVRAIMSFLMSCGVSTARAFRIYRVYGDQAIQQVKKDPYCLARDIHGIGFLTADKIAEKMGIARDSELRARAGVEYALMELTQQGHCACPREQLQEETARLLQIDECLAGEAIDHGLAKGRLVAGNQDYNRELVYLASLHCSETALAAHLSALAAGPHPCPGILVDKATAWAEEKTKISLSDDQRRALAAAITAKVLVITGGPGVGKTTLINAVIRILSAKKMQVVLCAPTGRAAKRMTESTRHPAKTIHRLLAYDPKSRRFRFNDKNPLAGDIFIVDEASMIDLPLAAQLISAIPGHASLILVGDVDQLPSVGPGNVLKDIIASGMFPVHRLTQIFRQATHSEIVLNAHRINQGLPAEPGEPGSESDFQFIERDDPEQVLKTLVGLVETSIPNRYRLDRLSDIQILTPMKRGLLGADHLNRRLQQALNPRPEGIERFGVRYCVGDKVMQQQNNYDKDVFNGDCGVISAIDEGAREMIVNFDGRPVSYDLQELDELLPSYAITIHKSQGSEYPCVVIPVHTQHYIMLQRNLLYTAITRGKKLVILIGSRKALAIATRTAEAGRRVTTLAQRLQHRDQPF